MKILVPLKDAESIPAFVEAGADEFYLGFADKKWFDIFGRSSDINRMTSFNNHANRFSFQQALDAIECIHSFGKSAFLTLNANHYTAKQLDYIKTEYLDQLKEVAVDGIIVSGPDLAELVRESGIHPVASTMCGIYNSDIAKSYARIGVGRMILPRDLGLQEIERIVQRCPEIYFEVFHMRNGCVFSDSHCLGVHSEQCGSTCGALRFSHKEVFSDYSSFEDLHRMELNSLIYSRSFHQDACAICAMYRFNSMGISSLKIVGRADDPASVHNDIVLTKRNLDVLENCSSELEYLEKMVFPSNARTMCLLGLSCYYPEVRFSCKSD